MVSLTKNEYAFKWGLGDPYPDAEKKLRKLLVSGKDFETHEELCNKELLSFRLSSKSGVATVSVCAWMDCLYDDPVLVRDALYDLYGADMELTPEEEWEIAGIAIDSGIDERCTETESLHSPNYERVIESAQECADRAMERLDQWYEDLKKIVAEYVEARKG